MRAKLIGPVERDKRRNRNEATITLGKPRPFPHVTEQHLVGQFRELGIHIPHQLLRAGGPLVTDAIGCFCACHRGYPPDHQDGHNHTPYPDHVFHL